MSGVTLTEQMILNKTKVASLADVHQLNLWGVGLTDVSVVAKLPNIQVLALATNQVSSLKCFPACSTLEELYLRKNNVSDLKEVAGLKGLKKLHTLWLMDNPCASQPYYREFVLHCCTHLKQLDKVEVTAEERAAAAKKLTAKALDEILGRSSSAAASAAASRPPQEKESVSPTPRQTSSISSARPASSPNNASSGNIIDDHNAGGKSVFFTTVQAQRAMLTAIVSLLPELTVESLELLEREVHTRVEKQKQQVSRLSQGELSR